MGTLLDGLIFKYCLLLGTSVLRARVGGHEEDTAADRGQLVGMETHGSRAAAGVSDAGSRAAENFGKTEVGVGQGHG